MGAATDLRDLAARTETTAGADEALFAEVAAVLAPVLAASGDRTPLRPQDLVSTDFVLHVIAHVLPGWAIRLRGRAFDPDGHWKCSLRPSESRDEAEVIGMSSGPDLSNVLLGSLLRVLAYQAEQASRR
ncbi:MAG: hypothetical protein N2422_00910 [Rhodobacteraceae bacterium]|nr:hypothetical protein [Paracoccaceae bacterium]